MRVGKPNRVTEQITEYARLAGGSIDLPSELTELCRREGKGSEFGTGGEATMTSSKSGQATALSTHRQYN